MPLRRGNAILLVIAVGVVFLVGLVVHGIVGGVLLLLVATSLVLVSAGARSRVGREAQLPRVLIIGAVLVLAVLKLSGRL